MTGTLRQALRPIETTQKLLISTTSRLVGEFERDDVVLALAWPGAGSQAMMRWSEGPLSRTAVVFAFETEPIAKLPGTLIPDYSSAGNFICSYLAVLFGKRFDTHGALETGDRDLGSILAKAPTYLGLERIARYALLRFAQANGAYLDPQNSGNTEAS
jgi:hypothetical protein